MSLCMPNSFCTVFDVCSVSLWCTIINPRACAGRVLYRSGVNGVRSFRVCVCVLVKLRMRGVYSGRPIPNTKFIYLRAYAAAAWKVIRKKGEEH